MCPLSGMSDNPDIPTKEDKMDKRCFWVLIETDEDNLGNPENPDIADIREVFRKGDSYGIAHIVPEADIADYLDI
jgi:hypothetical protein